MRLSAKAKNASDSGVEVRVVLQPPADTQAAQPASFDPALAPRNGFYFSYEDLRSEGYDDGLTKFLVWAVHSAQRTAHGDVKEIGKVLHFNNIARAYKYIKLARAVE